VTDVMLAAPLVLMVVAVVGFMVGGRH